MALITNTFHPGQRPQSHSAPMEHTEYMTHTLVRMLQKHEVLFEGICAWLTSICNRDDYVGYVQGIHRQFLEFEKAVRDDAITMESEFCGTYRWIPVPDNVRYKTCLLLSVVDNINITFEFQFVTDEAGRMRSLRINWGDVSRQIVPYKELKQVA